MQLHLISHFETRSEMSSTFKGIKHLFLLFVIALTLPRTTLLMVPHFTFHIIQRLQLLTTLIGVFSMIFSRIISLQNWNFLFSLYALYEGDCAPNTNINW